MIVGQISWIVYSVFGFFRNCFLTNLMMDTVRDGSLLVSEKLIA